MRVFIFGAGKVGRGLARAAKAAGVAVTLRPARRGLPKREIDADLLILTVRDRDIAPTAKALAARGLVTNRTACVHVAGALDATPLAALRGVAAGVAQMHPMISFASLTRSPTLVRGNVHTRGDVIAVKRARTFARTLGMTPRTFDDLDTVGYHAAAGLVANGAAALAAMGAELLTRAGVTRGVAHALLGPLLRSVADNVETLGFPAALTGPVRRGDRGAVERHLQTIRARLPSASSLYLASVAAQLPLARQLGEATAEELDALEAWLDAEMRAPQTPLRHEIGPTTP